MSHSITLNEHGFLENSKNQAHTAVPVVSQCLILSESPSNELTLDIRSFKKFLLKISKSQKQILKFSFEPKIEGKYFCISALASIMGQIKK